MSKTKPEEFPLTPREEKILFNTGRRVFATAFPNPERKGCPGSQVLKNLVFRVGTLSITERQQWFDHSAHCSPCFNEMAAYRKQYLNQRKIRRSLVLVIVGFLSWIAFRLGFQERSKQPDIVQPVVTPPSAPEPAPVPPSAQEQKPAEVQVVVLDLRKRGVARGESNNQDRDLDLPKGRLKLSIYLPIGSEEGNYEVRILGRQNQVLMTAKGKAQMQGHLNVLMVEADTSALEAGSHNLAIREVGWGWNRYPLRLR
jgi:hypothetical protein